MIMIVAPPIQYEKEYGKGFLFEATFAVAGCMHDDEVGEA